MIVCAIILLLVHLHWEMYWAQESGFEKACATVLILYIHRKMMHKNKVPASIVTKRVLLLMEGSLVGEGVGALLGRRVGSGREIVRKRKTVSCTFQQ